MEKGLILIADTVEQFDFLLDDLPERWLDRLSGPGPGPTPGWYRTAAACPSGSPDGMTAWPCASPTTRWSSASAR